MKASPVDVKSNKRVAGHTCFKDLAGRLCLSLSFSVSVSLSLSLSVSLSLSLSFSCKINFPLR